MADRLNVRGEWVLLHASGSSEPQAVYDTTIYFGEDDERSYTIDALGQKWWFKHDGNGRRAFPLGTIVGAAKVSLVDNEFSDNQWWCGPVGWWMDPVIFMKSRNMGTVKGALGLWRLGNRVEDTGYVLSSLDTAVITRHNGAMIVPVPLRASVYETPD